MIVAKSNDWYSAYSLYRICIALRGSWSDKAPVYSKRILKVGLSYLLNSTQFFLWILESKNLFQILG